MFHLYWNGSVQGITHVNKISSHILHVPPKKIRSVKKKKIICTAKTVCMYATNSGYHTRGYQTLPDLWKSWRRGQNSHILHKRVQGEHKKIKKAHKGGEACKFSQTHGNRNHSSYNFSGHMVISPQ